jgi:hypothetical protein
VLTARGFVTAALLVVVASLLAVGVVSQTVTRHAIQVAPGVVLLVSSTRRRAWAPFAAMAVFAFWLLIMALIWMFLLGLANVVTGNFSPVEVALTIVIGVASLTGLVAAGRLGERPSWTTRVAAFVVAGALQVGAMWLSLQPSFSAR